jgi:hypothetical protein
LRKIRDFFDDLVESTLLAGDNSKSYVVESTLLAGGNSKSY